MPDDVTYNQLIILRKNASIKCHQIKKSFTEKGHHDILTLLILAKLGCNSYVLCAL